MLRPFVRQGYKTTIPCASVSDFVFERLPEATVHVHLLVEACPRDGSLGRAILRVEGATDRLRSVRHAPVSIVTLGVELEIGAVRRVLGVSAASIFGASHSLDDLWGRPADELLDRMLSAPTPEARLSVLGDVLLARARAARPAPRSMSGVLRAIGEARGEVRVAQLAAQVGVSARQLQRHFVDEIGCAPKRYARIARLRRLVLSHHGLAGRSWADHAAELGYADQAHMISDFREMMGTSPERLLGQGDFVEDYLKDGWLLTPRVSDFHKTA